jgi:hypothetical protein
MRVLGLAFAVLLSGTVPIATHANGPQSNMGPANSRPAPGIVLAWDGGGSGGRSAAPSGQRTAAHPRQWNGQWGPPHWGPKPFLWRMGSLWRAGGPDVLGLRSRQRSL